MKNFFKKKTMKKSTVAVVVLVAMAVVGLVGFLSAGFTNMDVPSWVRERNPENLLEYDMPLEAQKKGNVYYSIDEEGTIYVEGTIPASEDKVKFTYELGTVKLEKGEYTLTCSKDCGEATYQIIGTYGDGKTWVSDDTDTRTVEFKADTEVTFSIVVYAEGEVDIEARPVLNEGNKPVDYFVKKTIGD